MPQACLEKLKVNEKQNLPDVMVDSGEDRRKIEYGFCQCGCGRKTWVSNRNDKEKSWIKGNPVRFVSGHGPKPMGDKHHRWNGDKVSMSALHIYIKRRLKKPELCQNCNKVVPYDLTNISGKYKRNLSDWKWLCRRCHMVEDGRINIPAGKYGKNLPLTKKISNKIVKYRKIKNMERRDLANFLNLSNSTIQRWEKRMTRIGSTHIKTLKFHNII